MGRKGKKRQDVEGRDASTVSSDCNTGEEEMAKLLVNMVLKHVLSDGRVQDAIRSIASGNKGASSDVGAELRTPAEEGIQTSEREQELTRRIFGLEKELAQIKDSRRDSALALQKSEAELRRVKGEVVAFQKVYEQFLALPNALRSNLKGFFCEKDVWSFLVSGSQPDRLRDFWDFCRNDLARGRLEQQRDVLLEIFTFFFDRINDSLGDDPQWLWQKVSSGMSFDSSVHSATAESAAVGKVVSVVWPGFVYATNNKVCRKSLVVVR